MRNKRILPRHRLRRDYALTARHQPPATGPKRLVQDPPVFDLGQVHDAVGFDLDVGRVERLQEDVGGFLGEGLSAEAVVGAGPVDMTVVITVAAVAIIAVEVEAGGFVVEASFGDVLDGKGIARGGRWGAGGRCCGRGGFRNSRRGRGARWRLVVGSVVLIVVVAVVAGIIRLEAGCGGLEGAWGESGRGRQAEGSRGPASPAERAVCHWKYSRRLRCVGRVAMKLAVAVVKLFTISDIATV